MIQCIWMRGSGEGRNKIKFLLLYNINFFIPGVSRLLGRATISISSNGNIPLSFVIELVVPLIAIAFEIVVVVVIIPWRIVFVTSFSSIVAKLVAIVAPSSSSFFKSLLRSLTLSHWTSIILPFCMSGEGSRFISIGGVISLHQPCLLLSAYSQ